MTAIGYLAFGIFSVHLNWLSNQQNGIIVYVYIKNTLFTCVISSKYKAQKFNVYYYVYKTSKLEQFVF